MYMKDNSIEIFPTYEILVNPPVLDKKFPTFWIDKNVAFRVPKHVSVGVGVKHLRYRDYLRGWANITKNGTSLLVWLAHLHRCGKLKGKVQLIGDCAFCRGKKHTWHAAELIRHLEEIKPQLDNLIPYIFEDTDGLVLENIEQKLNAAVTLQLQQALTLPGNPADITRRY